MLIWGTSPSLQLALDSDALSSKWLAGSLYVYVQDIHPTGAPQLLIQNVNVLFIMYRSPCIMFAYLGQGAYLIKNPGDVGSTFWSSVPIQV